MRRPTVLAALAIALAATGCNDQGQFGRTFPAYRYRLSVEINTPEGVRRGSNVIEVDTAQEGKYSLDAAYVGHSKVHGDAVVVDLGRRGKIFVILKDQFDQMWPSYIMKRFIEPVAGMPVQDERGIEIQRILALRGPIALHARIEDKRFPLKDELPDFVIFSDPSDLSTAKVIQPADLPSTFGSGVSLRGMTVQITDDPVTRSAVRALPWVADDDAYVRNSRAKQGRVEGALNGIDFSRI